MKILWFTLFFVSCLLLVHSSDPTRGNTQQNKNQESSDPQPKQLEVELSSSKIRDYEKKISELEQELRAQENIKKSFHNEKATFKKEKEELSLKIAQLEEQLSQQKALIGELENNLRIERQPLDKADEYVIWLRGQYQLLNQHFWVTYMALNDHLSDKVKPQLDELHEALQQHYTTHVHPQLESAHQIFNEHYTTHIRPQLDEAHQSLKPHLDEFHQKIQPHLDELHQKIKPHLDEIHQNIKPHISTAALIEEELIQRLDQHLPANFPTRQYLHYLFFMFSGLIVVWFFRSICCGSRNKITNKNLNKSTKK